MATLQIEAIESVAQLESFSRSELIEVIAAGLPSELARELASKLEINMEDMAILLRLTPRTWHRRLEQGRLGLAESERLWELTELFFRAADVLGNQGEAAQWFKSPIQALGWVAPLSFARSSVGIRELERILGRIEHGVFS
jgi:putative toxin-antitoxin system antitoxin component (TIGR02293 family)